MPEITEVADKTLELAQATELAQVVDLEARWENLRNSRLNPAGAGAVTQDLPGKQKAYELFRAKLRGYNKRYAPPHVPELLLNTAVRLGKWCRSMRTLFLCVESTPQARCPVNLLEKAYRWADKVAARMSKSPIHRPASPAASVPAAVQELEAIAMWCDSLEPMAK
jgi:hypothetical protein